MWRGPGGPGGSLGVHRGKSAANPDLTFRYTFDGQVDGRNQLTLIRELDIDEQELTETAPIYDAAGSLMFDGGCS